MSTDRLLPCLLAAVALCFAQTEAVRGQVPAAPMAEDSDITALDSRVKDFLDKVAADQAQQAIKDLLADNPLMDSNKQSDAINNLSSKAAELKANYGECLERERVVARKVGTRLVVLRYICQCERFPVVWHFVFYRPPQRRDAVVRAAAVWHLITIRFDTDVERLAD